MESGRRRWRSFMLVLRSGENGHTIEREREREERQRSSPLGRSGLVEPPPGRAYHDPIAGRRRLAYDRKVKFLYGSDCA